jgi:hypothetical protein
MPLLSASHVRAPWSQHANSSWPTLTLERGEVAATVQSRVLCLLLSAQHGTSGLLSSHDQLLAPLLALALFGSRPTCTPGSGAPDAWSVPMVPYSLQRLALRLVRLVVDSLTLTVLDATATAVTAAATISYGSFGVPRADGAVSGPGAPFAYLLLDTIGATLVGVEVAGGLSVRAPAASKARQAMVVELTALARRLARAARFRRMFSQVLASALERTPLGSLPPPAPGSLVATPSSAGAGVLSPSGSAAAQAAAGAASDPLLSHLSTQQLVALHRCYASLAVLGGLPDLIRVGGPVMVTKQRTRGRVVALTKCGRTALVAMDGSG